MVYYLCVFLVFAGSMQAHIWQLGGNVAVQFESTASFEYTESDAVQFAAHLPGFHEGDCAPNLLITHTYIDSDEIDLKQQPGRIDIESSWNTQFPQDFIHLLYGAARLSWLEHNIFPVHAACIGNDSDGYILLMGAPGSGKTSLTLHSALYNGYQVYSGDKTLLRFGLDGALEAIAGTRTITVRSEDIGRWDHVPMEQEVVLGDRLAFQLPPSYYTEATAVTINKIYLIDANDGAHLHTQLSEMSALHTLYPFFIDKQREDTLLGGDKAMLDGAVGLEVKLRLQKDLHHALQEIPVYKVVGSIEEMSSTIHAQRKILFGICGIGNGHYNRQLPIVRHMLDQGHDVMIFTYGEGLAFFTEKFPKHHNLTVIPVANPYYVGSSNGLEFGETAQSEKNRVDFTTINALAMQQAVEQFGRPDLVISDYEMVSAQYSYVKSAPLVTLDQQSKYLECSFPLMLEGTSYIDEVERLHLFFPKAEKRLAVSFFDVPRIEGTDDVTILGPMIRPEVVMAKGTPKSITPSVLVYITAQQLGVLPVDEWIQTIRSALPDGFEAHIFLPKRLELPESDEKLHFYTHGNPIFDRCLIEAHGIVSTAGHTLLSEAMYLEIPVFALPLPLYEQQLNGHILELGGFGMCEQTLTHESLELFLNNLELYRQNIQNDSEYLIKEPGNDRVISLLEELL